MARVGRVRVVWRRLAPGNAIAGPRPSGRVATVGGAARRDRRGPRPPGCVSARWGHRRCLHPHGPGTLGPSGRKRRGRRAVCSPGGGIDVVYTPAAREHTGRGNGAVLGAGSRVGVVGWVPSSLRVVRGVLLGPVGRVLLPFLVCPVGGAAGIRAGRGRSGRSGGLAGIAGVVGRVLLPIPYPPGGRVAGSVPCGVRGGCGVSGRLVRRRCRSGRCAGGTRGRDWTSRWWSPPPGG